MSHKMIKRVSGGFTIYYGIGSLLGAILGFIGLLVWLYNIVFLNASFSFVELTIIISLIVVSGLIAYILLRVGYEELES